MTKEWYQKICKHIKAVVDGYQYCPRCGLKFNQGE